MVKRLGQPPRTALTPAMPHRLGYARVSSGEQSAARQVDELRAASWAEVLEETASGGDRGRPVLATLLRRLRRGDTLVVVKLDRLPRSLEHLLEVVRGLEARGAYLRVLGDPIDTATPQGHFMLQLLGAVAEFERALIRERVASGWRAAWRGPRARAGAAATRPWSRATRRRCAACGTPARTPTSPASPPAPRPGCPWWCACAPRRVAPRAC